METDFPSILLSTVLACASSSPGEIPFALLVYRLKLLDRTVAWSALRLEALSLVPLRFSLILEDPKILSTTSARYTRPHHWLRIRSCTV